MQNCAEWRSLPKVVVHAAGSYAMAGAMMICDCEPQERKLKGDRFVLQPAKDRPCWPWETRMSRGVATRNSAIICRLAFLNHF
jgi:hypothetical protein